MGGSVVDDVVYAIPHQATSILIFNPKTDEMTSSATTTSVEVGTNQWIGNPKLVIGRNIYGVPYNNNKILIYNVDTGVVSGSNPIPSTIASGNSKYLNGAAHGKYIYGIPDAATKVLVYNTVTNTFTVRSSRFYVQSDSLGLLLFPFPSSLYIYIYNFYMVAYADRVLFSFNSMLTTHTHMRCLKTMTRDCFALHG